MATNPFNFSRKILQALGLEGRSVREITICVRCDQPVTVLIEENVNRQAADEIVELVKANLDAVNVEMKTC